MVVPCNQDDLGIRFYVANNTGSFVPITRESGKLKIGKESSFGRLTPVGAMWPVQGA